MIDGFDMGLDQAARAAICLTDSVDIKLFATYTSAMDISLGPDVKSKLERLAAEQGRDAESLAREAIERFVDYDAWFIREVEKGLGQIESGKVLSHEQVGSRLERLLQDKQSLT